MKLKYVSLFLSILTVMLFVMTEPVGVLALEKNRVPDIDESQPKSLTIEFYFQTNGVDVPIKGAEIGIYKIADLQTKGGSADYTVTEPYRSLQKVEGGRDVTFNGLSVTEMVALSGEFSKLAAQADQTAVTDSKGFCKFDNLEQGMYLVKEISAKDDALKYNFFAEYMISVPFFDETGANEWQYDVQSQPKTPVSPHFPDQSDPSHGTDDSSKPEPDESSDSSVTEESSKSDDRPSQPSESSAPEQPQSSTPVFTGDSSVQSVVMISLWGISLIAVLVTLTSRKTKRKGADESE